ncbi:unnamed protein product [Ectocarpus sp. 6 AP-2014]
MAALVVDEAGGEPLVLPEDPPSPTWWPLEESLAARGRRLPIYTFASQFAGEHASLLFDGDGNDDQNREALSLEQVADVDFLRGLNLQGLEAGGAAIAPLRRFMVSPAAAAAGGGKKSRYDEDNLPTPATLVADLKATGNFKSAITDMDDDGSGAPLPYLGYLVFACADEVHEDDEKQYIFATSEDLAEAVAEAESEVVDAEADEGDMGAEAYREITLRSRAQLTALKQYVLKQRVFYVLIHTNRRHDVGLAGEDMGSDVILLALGVSPATGNLVGVIAIQACHNLCD